MKNLFIITTLLLLSISCKAQTTISLEQAYEYNKIDSIGIPMTVTYVKDINNRLDQFVGTWKGTYNGKTYEFRFIKKLNFGSYSVKWDKLIGRVLIKDSNGTIIYNTTNVTDDTKTGFEGYTFQSSSYMLNFYNMNDTYCNDGGVVYMGISKTNPKIMYLSLSRDIDWVDLKKCPNYSTYVPILPKDKITLTKQ